MKKRGLRQVSALAMACSMVFGLVQVPGISTTKAVQAAENFNYGEALQKSLIFYELQKSGELDGAEFNRNNWRADSCLKDGQDNGVDLTGGWFDAGDNAKFNLPMSYTATMLAWSYLQNTEAYKTSGQEKYLLNELEWVNDYFVKCHPEDNVYYYQVGDGTADHAYWGACETVEQRMERPSYKVDNTAENGGSAVCGQTAAALATASIALKESEQAKATTYLKHAKEIYQMAEEAKSDAGYTEADNFYKSWSGYYDELSWAAYWLYEATDDKTYLDKAVEYAGYFGPEAQGSDEIKYSYTHCWDDAHIAASYVLAMCDEVTDKAEYISTMEKNIKFWLGELKGKGGDQITYTEGGLAWMYQWGSIRYATTAGFLATVYAKWDGADSELATKAWNFAKQQADYALGSTGQSYQIGYGENYPKNPHHRTAHGPWGDSLKTDPDETRHVLMGALVGGPQSADDSDYEDDRGNYYTNEVACDYNAGFTGLVAAMYQEYGGEIDPNVNAIEEVGEELFVEAAINAEDNTNAVNFVEFKTVVYNRTAWPARVTDNLVVRIFVDVDDADPSQFSVSANYSQSGADPSELKKWDKQEGIYYTDLDLSGVGIYPGGQSQHRCETQIRISANAKWDYSNSPSLVGLEGTSNMEMARATGIALYDGGQLVYGSEPGGETATTAAATARPDTTERQTTEQIATVVSTTIEQTESETTTEQLTTAEPTEVETTTEQLTTAEQTENEPTEEITTAEPTTQQRTTERATTEQSTTQSGNVGPVNTNNDDWLHIEGSDIKDKYGNVVRLTGANWFGFNCGERVLHGLWSADIDVLLQQCADRGINILRIPISTELLLEWKDGKAEKAGNFSNSPDWTFNPELVNEDGTAMTTLEVMDKLMVLCKKHGIKVLIDCHSALADNSGHVYPMWYNTEAGITTEDWIEGWKFIVERYKNDDTFIAADLENEPHGKRDETEYAKWDNSTDVNNWKYAAEQCAEEILKINPNMLILVEGIEQNPKEGYTYDDEAIKTNEGYVNYEGAWWGGNLRLVGDNPIQLSNAEWNQQIMYSPHDYGPSVYNQTWFDKDFTEQTLLDDYWYDAWAYLVEENISPLLMGEWGGHMDGGKNEKWLNLLAEYMNKKNISHTFWCLNPNSGDTGGLLDSSFINWDEDKYALLEGTLWQTKDGTYIGLDHAKGLGSNGMSVSTYYNQELTPSNPTEEQATTEKTTESRTEVGEATEEKTTEKVTEGQTNADKGTEGQIKTEEATEEKTTEKITEGQTKTEATTQKKTTEKGTEGQTESEKTTEQKTTVKPTEGQTESEKTTEQKTTVKPTEGQTESEKTTEQKTTVKSTESQTEDEKTTEQKSTEQATTKTEGTSQSTTENQTPEEVAVEEVTISKKDVTLVVGEKVELSATISPSNATNKEVTWESSNGKIASVDANGKVTAIKEGTVIISAVSADGKHKAECLVTVNEKTQSEIGVDTVLLTSSEVSMTEGQDATLTALVLPINASNKNVIWKTSNASIVSVDDNGKIVAVKEGEATITVITEDGAKTAECKVTVSKKAATTVVAKSVQLNKQSTSVKVGDKFLLVASVLPDDTTNKEVEWAAIGSNVSVDANGNVTALKAGTAVVTATTKDGGAYAYCVVTVTEEEPVKVAVESVSLNTKTLELTVGGYQRLLATVLPEDAEEKKVIWSVDNGSVVSVDTAGVVTALKAGTAVVTATTVDGQKTASCTVTVKADEAETVFAKSIILNMASTDLVPGDTANLTATISPVNVTNKKVIWSTDNADVATVDENGIVTAKGEGTAIITATSQDGMAKAECKITVNAETKVVPVERIEINPEKITMKSGDTSQVQVSVYPVNATNQEYTLESSDSKVAVVDSKGQILAVGQGIAVITAKTKDGGMTAICQVVVEEESKPADVEVSKVTLNAESAEMTIGDTKKFVASVEPSDATNKTIIWSSTNEQVAAVSQDGTVKAVGEGNATIAATAANGQYALINVTVKKEETPVTKVEVQDISVSPSTMTLALKKTKTLKVSVSPANATDKMVTYSSSNASVATVSSTGTVKAVAPGVAKIKVKAGSVVKSVTVKVKPAKVTSLKKTKLSKTKIKISWKKQSKVTGYKVYRYSTKTKKYKLYKITKRNYVSVANLKKNATYRFKVKAYKRSGSAVVNGDTSKVYKVKMK